MTSINMLALFDDPLPLADPFETWYAAYPRHVAKGAARKAYERVIHKKMATRGELMVGALRYTESKRGTDVKFIKHPATWLNSESWLDEFPPPAERASLYDVARELER